MLSLSPMNSFEETQAAIPAIPVWFKYSLIHPAVSYLLIAVGVLAPGIVSYFLMLLVDMLNIPGVVVSSYLGAQFGIEYPFTMLGLWSSVSLGVPLTWLFVVLPLCRVIYKSAISHL